MIERLKIYTGVSLKWDCIQSTFTLPIPEYVKQTLHKFRNTLRNTSAYAPLAHVVPTYNRQVQYEEPVDTSYLLPTTETKLMQNGYWEVSILWNSHRQHNFSFIERYLIITLVCQQKKLQKTFFRNI